MQAAELAAQLQTLSAQKAEVATALEALQAQHTAATESAAEAAATAAQALSQLEAQKASLEERVVELTVTAQEHARYQQELEGMATVPSSSHATWPPAILGLFQWHQCLLCCTPVSHQLISGMRYGALQVTSSMR